MITFGGVTIYRIAGGKAAETWWQTDTFGEQVQLGAIPTPGAAST